MFAIVTIAGKQYKAAKGDVLLVSHLEGEVGDSLTFDHVLMLSEGTNTKIGTPVVEGATVKGKIVAQEKGEKLEIRRYKSKVRYRKSTGFRSQLTRVEIVSVG